MCKIGRKVGYQALFSLWVSILPTLVFGWLSPSSNALPTEQGYWYKIYLITMLRNLPFSKSWILCCQWRTLGQIIR